MFSSNQIKSFNDVEMLIYNYIMQNAKQIRYMTIRELADAVRKQKKNII